MTVQDPEVLRKEGNDLMKAGNLTGAIQKYSEAVSIAKDDHMAYSNRSAAYIAANDIPRALEDAETCIRLAPRWIKSYIRKVNALRASGRFEEATSVCEAALSVVDPDDVATLQSLKGQCQIDMVHQTLNGAWRGKVADEMGGYYQTMVFGKSNTVKIEVFGRHQNCTYSLDLSRSPALMTILFGPGGTTTTVPYIFEIRDEGSTLEMCCPFLTPDIPSIFEGPGHVTMKRWDGRVVDEETVQERKAAIANITDSQERMRLYLEAFAQVITDASLKIDAAVPTGLQSDDETDANKKVIQVMSMHVKITELEDIYGKSTAKSAFGIISGGDDYFVSSDAVKTAAERLRDLLLSTGFITPEGLEQARLQYTRPKVVESDKNSSRAKLQKKLLEKRNTTQACSLPEEKNLRESDQTSEPNPTEVSNMPSDESNSVSTGKALFKSPWVRGGLAIMTLLFAGLYVRKSISRK